MSTQAQTTIDVTCGRCGGQRWVPLPYVPLDAKGRPTGPPSDLREPDGYLCLLCRFTPAEEWAARQDARQGAARKMIETKRGNARRLRLTSLERPSRCARCSESAVKGISAQDH